MKRIIAIAVAIVALSGGIAAPTQAAPKKYTSCAAVQKAYPAGVAKSKAADKRTAGKQKVSKALYARNKRLDRDRDGVVCEQEHKAAPEAVLPPLPVTVRPDGSSVVAPIPTAPAPFTSPPPVVPVPAPVIPAPAPAPVEPAPAPAEPVPAPVEPVPTPTPEWRTYRRTASDSASCDAGDTVVSGFVEAPANGWSYVSFYWRIDYRVTSSHLSSNLGFSANGVKVKTVIYNNWWTPSSPPIGSESTEYWSPTVTVVCGQWVTA